MAVYYINILLILGLAWPLCIYKPNKIKKAAYLVITFGWMWVLATFRYGIGYDYRDYIRIFQDISALQGIEVFTKGVYEPGFVLLTKLISLFTESSVVMYGVYAALIYLPVMWFIYRYVKDQDAWLSVWIYLTLAYFYASMSFIRQSMTCSIMLLAYPFLRDKKPVPYMVIALLAMSMHKAAFIMIPVYFFSQIRLDKKMGAFYAAATVVLYLGSEFFLGLALKYFFSYYEGEVYVQQGFSVIFLLVPFTIFGLCLALKPIWEKRDPSSIFLMNFMTYSAMIWLFITRHFVLERLSMPIYIFAIIAVPSALSSLLASDEDVALLEELKAEEKHSAKKGKSRSVEAQAKVRQLKQHISDHKKYYWSAVVAFVLITGLYNEFGANVNNFHAVFPYRSVLEFFNRIS